MILAQDLSLIHISAEKGEPRKKKVLVFGSGPIRIGQGIEFDYCSVHCVWTCLLYTSLASCGNSRTAGKQATSSLCPLQ